jgi:hypothetical protein
MKKLLITVSLAMVSIAGVNAQILYNGGTYTENFDGLIGTGSVSSVFSNVIGTQAGIPGLSGWQGAKIGGTGTTPTNFTANNGSSGTGGLYSYGSTGDSDRALGALASGTNIMAFGASFTNNTGTTLTSVTLTFDAEFWRVGQQPNTLNFYWGLSSGGITNSNFLSSASMTPLSALDISLTTGATSASALDGNLPANRIPGITSTFSLTWNPNDILFIAWRDVNETGDDAGLAVDNFSMTAIPEPSTYALIIGGGLLLLGIIRRRSQANA